MTKKLTIELPDDLVRYAEAKVAEGEYGTVDEAIATGVSIMRDGDALIERWVREEVVPSYDQWVADGEPTRSSDEVFDDLEARIKERMASKAS